MGLASVSGLWPVASPGAQGFAQAEAPGDRAASCAPSDDSHAGFADLASLASLAELDPFERLLQHLHVSDTRSHRGPNPKDAELFNERTQPVLRAATSDLSWLMSRGYGSPSALKLVGDRYALVARQREAVLRSTCSDDALARRALKREEISPGETLWIDGLNVLLTVEVALGGGVVLLGRDGCVRDIASVHGTYRRVEETWPALQLLGRVLAERGARRVHVVLDSPVSNTRKLAGLIREAWGAHLNVEVELAFDADRVLIESRGLVASADSRVLDECACWVNLARVVVGDVSHAHLLDLG